MDSGMEPLKLLLFKDLNILFFEKKKKINI